MNYRSASARREGLTEDEISRLDHYRDSNLSNAEKAAICYVETLAIDHLAIDDAMIDELRRYFSEAQIVELAYAAAAFIGLGRVLAAFGVRWAAPEPVAL